MSDSFVTPWTVAFQAPLSMGFPRQEYWSGLLFPSSGDLLDTGMKPAFPALTSGFLTTEPPGKPGELIHIHSEQNFNKCQSNEGKKKKST